jgi:hypothetical protein
MMLLSLSNVLHLKNEFTLVLYCIFIWDLCYVFYISDINWERLYKRERRRADRLVLGIRKVRQDLEAYRSHTKGLKRKIDYYKYK